MSYLATIAGRDIHGNPVKLETFFTDLASALEGFGHIGPIAFRQLGDEMLIHKGQNVTVTIEKWS